MSEEASAQSEKFLKELGVNLWLDKVVKSYDGQVVTIDDGTTIRADKVIWAAGITGNKIEGIPASSYARGNRLICNEFNEVTGLKNVFALGDIALQTHEPAWPNGHPQVAQPAIQQGRQLAKNLVQQHQGGAMQPFRYTDLGSMATIGRHRAVADLPFWKTQGILAWMMWLLIHLLYILGTKNKIFVFLNWVWNYLTYDQSLRLVIKPWRRN
jgi:NADH dehydrogenase